MFMYSELDVRCDLILVPLYPPGEAEENLVDGARI